MKRKNPAKPECCFCKKPAVEFYSFDLDLPPVPACGPGCIYLWSSGVLNGQDGLVRYGTSRAANSKSSLVSGKPTGTATDTNGNIGALPPQDGDSG